MDAFIPTLNQMAVLFLLIAAGYVLVKVKVLHASASTVLARLVNNVFLPANILLTFANQFTVGNLSSNLVIILGSVCLLAVLIAVSIVLSKVCTKDEYLRKIYTYALTFSNFGFMGYAVIGAVFPALDFAYKIFTLPFWFMIYAWGAPVLLMSNEVDGKELLPRKTRIVQRFKSFVNPLFISMLIGIILGLTGVGQTYLTTGSNNFMYTFISMASNCMSPMAMILTGITISTISLKKTFTSWSVYLVSIIKLVVYPLAFFLVTLIFQGMDKTIVLCCMAMCAMPTGLNTIVIPSAYGKDTSFAGGLAVVSHLLSCITIPLVFCLV